MDIIMIIILALYGALGIIDGINTDFGFIRPVIAGMFVGLLLGDVNTGLQIGATLQLMVLGLGNFGGASIPDYMVGAIVGTYFAVKNGVGAETGLAIAVPVGLLMTQLDVLARTVNVYFQHMAEKAADEANFKKVELANLLGHLSWGLSRALPIFVVLCLGQPVVEKILAVSPEWLINGFKIAGKALPTVGIAILLKYMPLKKFWMYALLGFTLYAYLGLPIVGVAFVGLFFASINFFQDGNTLQANDNVIGGSMDYDE